MLPKAPYTVHATSNLVCLFWMRLIQTSLKTTFCPVLYCLRNCMTDWYKSAEKSFKINLVFDSYYLQQRIECSKQTSFQMNLFQGFQLSTLCIEGFPRTRRIIWRESRNKYSVGIRSIKSNIRNLHLSGKGWKKNLSPSKYNFNTWNHPRQECICIGAMWN